MAEVNRQVAASSDDCHVFNTTIRTTRDNIALCISRYFAHSYIRFLDIPIPLGSLIDHAHIELCSFGRQVARANLRIRGIKEPNTATFSTGIDVEARPMTDVSKDWNVEFPYHDPDWLADTWHGWPDGPELKDIIQEIVNQGGWVSGNALVIKLEALNSDTSKSVWAYDGDPTKAPVLVITFTPPALQFSLTIAATVGGTTDPAPATYTFDAGTTVVLAAIPHAGYQFVEWQENGVPISAENPINLLMDADMTITAVFVEEVTALPLKVTGLNVANIAETSFNLGWVPNSEPVNLYRVYVRKL